MKKEEELIGIIMAGGVGTRFWPSSTKKKPKQFLELVGDRSLLRSSFERLCGIIPAERILILTNETFVDFVAEQIPEVPVSNIVGEPMRRDTSAAAALGALLCSRRYGNPVIITVTADHLIEPVDLFQKTVLSVARQARKSGALYTFGIQPDYPATGYGYLELGEPTFVDDGVEHFKLMRFKEKPDFEKAKTYVDSGRFMWNSGMFAWRADAILEEMSRQIPDHVKLIRKAVESDGSESWKGALKAAFEPLVPVSVDFAVMENALDIRCVKAGFTWSDVGSWESLRTLLPKDDEENAFRGRFYQLDSSENLVFCEDTEETVLLVGVKDLIAVRAGSRTLIVRRDRAEDVKKLVQKLMVEDED